MPLRSELLRKRWSAADLPILPFLAPRVFTPWPWSGRRLHSSTQPDGWKSELASQENIRWPQNDKSGGEGSSETTTPLKWNRKREIRNGQRIRGSTPKDTTETGDHSLGELAKPSFAQKYEEIWGSLDSISSLDNEQSPSVRLVQAEDSGINGIEHHPTRRNGSDITDTEATNYPFQKAIPRYKDFSKERPKWVAVGGLGFWHKAFARLNAHHANPVASESTSGAPGSEETICPQYVRRDLITTDPSALREQWETFSQDTRIQIWPDLMIEALRSHPAEALKVLTTTYNAQHSPAFAVSDSLEFIVLYYLKNAGTDKGQVAVRLQEAITSFLSQYPTDRLYLSQTTIYELLSNIGDENLEGFYNTLTETNQSLHANTLMHFLSRFSKSGQTDIGFKILEVLGSRDVDFSSPQMMSVCSSLLHAPTQGQSSPATNAQRFQFMLSHGMRPNIITYNILIQNALHAGDIETGWQIHDLMVEQAIAPDAYTYSILLNDAKLRMDASAIQSIMGYLKNNSIRSPYLVTDVLHTIMLLHRREESDVATNLLSAQAPETAFKRMLDVYWENFNLDPLHHLIPDLKMKYPSTYNHDLGVSAQHSHTYPPAPTLIVMITGYLRDLGSKATLEIYQHFHRLVRSGDELSLSLMSTTHIWNTFLLALGRFPDTVFDCPRVLGMMIAANPVPTTAKVEPSPSVDVHKIEQGYEEEFTTLENLTGLGAIGLDATPEAAMNVDRETELPGIRHLDQLPMSLKLNDSQTQVLPTLSKIYESPKNQGSVQPDIYTWTILLKVFADHQLPRAAEKVLSAMQQRNITPNLITWNTLAYGYSRGQNVAMVADTLDRMAGAGFTPDEATMKALLGVRDRRKLIQALGKKEAEGRGSNTKSSFVGKRFVTSLKNELKQDRPEVASSIDLNWRRSTLR